MKEEIQILPAKNSDWEWIIDCHAATIWDSLTIEHKLEISKPSVLDQAKKQIEKSKEEHGSTNQAFVIIERNGKRVGFVWAEQVRSSLTGKASAHILDVFVVESFRGKGLGRSLLHEVETWAIQRGLSSITLNVAAHNSVAIGLYKGCGFKTEALRMNKSLGEQSGGE